MIKKDCSLIRTKIVTVLMSIAWVLMIPLVFCFAMEGNGEYHLHHEKEPIQ